ncbi:tRNA-pseudouridine synthase [Coprinopsis sp. MPI-PUGE-AT-0042]|nr:tRNA-pseudouridine synthase [Coprinopsis sp. MPI-PUGE-AT-0042]
MILRPTATSFFHALNPTLNRPALSRATSTFSTPSTPSPHPVPPPIPHSSPTPAIDWSTISSHPGIPTPILKPTTSATIPPITSERTAINRSTKRHLNLIPLSPAEQFKHNLFSLIRSTLMSGEFDFTKPKEVPAPPGLKKIAPYWYPYTTMTKMRWIGRELLEVVSTEFRDRSMEYYRYALESGVTTVNGEIASPTTILRDGDRVENVVHRHEPPVTSTPVRILHTDAEREFIVVDKPGSIPVHASGRYYKNTLIEILVNDFGIPKCYPANRLDRLTSGLMIIPTSPARARELTDEFTKGTVKKEYIARVRGKFPEEPVTCSEPLLTVDRQMGLNIVHPEGKPALTVFTRLFYDEGTDSSVVRCEPHTGRSHQLRVHLQFLGHPIANDPVYSEQRIWGASMGKGGVDTTPSDERSAPAPPPHLHPQAPGDSTSTGEATADKLSLAGLGIDASAEGGAGAGGPDWMIKGEKGKPKLLPRETGEDIGMGSPVPLSAEAVGVITRLRNMKDEDEDWSRWRDVVFRVKGALNPHHLVVTPPPLPNRRKRGGKAKLMIRPSRGPPGAQTESLAAAEGANSSGTSDARTSVAQESISSNGNEAASPSPAPTPAEGRAPLSEDVTYNPPQFTEQEIIQKVAEAAPSPDLNALVKAAVDASLTSSSISTQGTGAEADEKAQAVTQTIQENLYCPECYLPLHPDPRPEKLYIFLHARKYTTSLGAFETEMPEWATPGWSWDQS